jgi:hypothetical protein
MKTTIAPIYQLKIQLKDIDPPIWRRILVSGDISLGELHEVIQVTMGWTNTHLHEFVLDSESYSAPEDEIDDSRDEHRYPLVQVAPQARKSFEYLYDFGDGWEHKIVVERTVEADKRYAGHPICIAGARACPPEDCGGPGGYDEFLRAITNPKHKRHKEMRDWIGGDFDPEHFDPDEISDILKEFS